MDLGLDNSVAIVTGANSGIGLAVAASLLNEGVRVVGVDRELDSFYALNQPSMLSGAPGDVTDPDTATSAARNAIEQFGRVDILVNCAGIFARREGGFLSVPDDEWNRLWDVNVMGYVRMSRAVLPLMIEQRSGSLVHIASIRARMPDPQQPDYATTKAAVVTLSKTLSREFSEFGIRSNVVSPGSTRSPAWDVPGGMVEGLAKQHNMPPEAALEHEMRVVRKVPLGRLANPDEIANVVTLLASTAATGYVTGQDFIVDGGLIPTT